MNEVVKYDNSFNKLSLRNFTATELDLLMCLCSKMREKNTKKIIFTFEQLKSLSNYKPTANKRFINDLQKTNKKLMHLNFKLNVKNGFYQFILFNTFFVNTVNLTLTVGVNEDFKFVLNNLTSNFTRFELEEFINLKSEYSKKLYRILKQYKSSGWWKVNTKEFIRILDIPQSYDSRKIGMKILNRCTEELSKYFNNLKCNKIRASKRGRPIIAYEFTFDKEVNTTSTIPVNKTNDNVLDGQTSIDETKLIQEKQEITPTYKDTKFWGLLDRLDLTEVQIQDIYREMIIRFRDEQNIEISFQYEFLDHCVTKLQKFEKTQPVRSRFAFLKFLIASEKI